MNAKCHRNFSIFQVYSVVNGTANVFIWSNGLNLNRHLIEKSFGEFCEENFLSKVNISDNIQLKCHVHDQLYIFQIKTFNNK